ncbi:hypothetical protein Tco_1431641, partial [Tanacetum coccineum]
CSAPLSLAIEQPVTLEPTQSNVRRHSPLDGVPSLGPFRDDRYGCLVQQSGSVETQGESSGTGCEPCAITNSGILLTMADTTGSTHVGPPASTPS